MIPSQCFMCTQMSVVSGVCQRCGYSRQSAHPLHPNDQPEEPCATPSNTTTPDCQPLPDNHGPVADEWDDWNDLGQGG